VAGAGNVFPKASFPKSEAIGRATRPFIKMKNVSYYTLQDFPWNESIEAVKASERFDAYADFYQYMQEHLPQNSPETRQRYAMLIRRRFFPGKSLDDLIPTVWRNYHNEKLLTELMRVTALEAEPVIARFILDYILVNLPGTELSQEQTRKFIEQTYGEFKSISHERLLLSCRHMGYLGRYKRKVVVERIDLSENAFLILLHDRLAPTPRIISLKDIIAQPWYWFLGGCELDDIRPILQNAQQAGLIARYARVDELEQITTCFSRNDYLQQAKLL
jgi:hypothetical protein